MNRASLDTMIGEVLRETGLSTPSNPLSAELHRFIHALREKADGLVHRAPGMADLTITRNDPPAPVDYSDV